MRNAWKRHPNLLSWVALALGMVIIVIFAARNVGFRPAQWAAILVATVLLAGLCVWIVSWEDSAEDESRDAVAGGGEPSAGEAQGVAANQGAVIAEKSAAGAAYNGDL